MISNIERNISVWPKQQINRIKHIYKEDFNLLDY